MKQCVERTFWATAVIAAMFSTPFVNAQTRQRAELTFVANQSSDNLSGYSIKAGGGLLVLPNSPFAAGGAPNSVAVVPSGLFIYVADVIPGGISAFSVNQSKVLTTIPGSPFPAATGTAFVTTDPSGRFLYALSCGADCSGSGSGEIQAFSIDQQTGVLTPVAGSPFVAGQYPYSLAVDPTGYFAYVANAGSGDVYTFAIDNSSGALTQVGLPTAAGTRPLSVVVDPWGQFVYAANTGSSDVSVFAINFDGSLTAVAGSPFKAGPYVAGVITSQNGKYILVAAGAGVYVYSVQSSGALDLLAGSPVAAGTGPNGIALDLDDAFAYVVNAGSSNVSAYSFNSQTGKLTPVKGSPYSAEAFAAGIATSPVPTHQ
ncbi:MAG TPA: beta-propeller fold lactonase family protein [Candidatus Sulfotelmatobacter sp.]|jgi:6-phosphogluconolactonase (cycloisomerase 2 family)